MKQEKFDYLLGICDDAFARYGLAEHGRIPFEELTEIEQVFVCIWSLRGQVDNGGFHQYYSNPTGDLAVETIAACKKIGAKHTADLVVKANSFFQNDKPPKDRNARIEQLDKLMEQAHTELETLDDIMYQDKDKLDELMYDFVMQRQKQAPTS